MPLANLTELHRLLTHRLTLIADKKMREEEPARQLEELQKTSEAITAWHKANRSSIDSRLNHFLIQASFQKALDWIEDAKGA